jgi:hypothetical protein
MFSNCYVRLKKIVLAVRELLEAIRILAKAIVVDRSLFKLKQDDGMLWV